MNRNRRQHIRNTLETVEDAIKALQLQKEAIQYHFPKRSDLTQEGQDFLVCEGDKERGSYPEGITFGKLVKALSGVVKGSPQEVDALKLLLMTSYEMHGTESWDWILYGFDVERLAQLDLIRSAVDPHEAKIEEDEGGEMGGIAVLFFEKDFAQMIAPRGKDIRRWKAVYER